MSQKSSVQRSGATSPLAMAGIFAAGVAGGLLGWWSGIPAGALLGSVVTVGAISLYRDVQVDVPGSFKVISRVTIGSVIGSFINFELLGSLGGMLIWAVVFSLFMIAVGLVCAWVILRTSPLDRKTAVIACSPGGLVEMSALADELGGRGDIVLAVHMFRKLAALGMAFVALLVLAVS